MKLNEDQFVFVIIGVIVLVFILFLPKLITLQHTYTYEPSDKKKDEQTEENVETDNKQETDDNKQEEDKNQNNNQDNNQNNNIVAGEVSKSNGSVRCSIVSNTESYTLNIAHIFYFEDYKVKRVNFETNTTYKKDIDAKSMKAEADKENTRWKEINGITVTSSFDEATSTTSTSVLMDLSIGTYFESNDGANYTSNIKYDDNINDILKSDAYESYVCEER